MAAHIFTVGSLVALNADGPMPGKAARYVVEAQMPPLGSSLQYRIKSEAEGFRRVAVEHQLRAFDAPLVSPQEQAFRPHPGEEN